MKIEKSDCIWVEFIVSYRPTVDARTLPVIVFKSFLVLIISLTSVIGNSMVLAVVYRNQWLRTLTNAYIVNLAISDILMAILCIPLTSAVLITVKWSLGDTMCKFQGILGVSLHGFYFLTNHDAYSSKSIFSYRASKKISIRYLPSGQHLSWYVLWAAGQCFGKLYVSASGGEIIYIPKAGTCFPRLIPLVVAAIGFLLPSGYPDVFVLYLGSKSGPSTLLDSHLLIATRRN